jgi:lambda family phage tail tape measure protein
MNLDALLKIKAVVSGEEAIRRLGNSMQGLQGKAKNAALGFNSLKGAVAGFGAAIAGSAIVGGLTAVVKKSIDAGDELFNLQAKTGVAANALIGIGNAAKLADVDMGTLSKGLNKLNVNLVKAAEGNDALASNFKRLGVDVKDANGQVVPADKALKQIADRFADMPDGAQKAAAAVALFGKSGADLIPLLNEGAASMERFTYKVGEDFAARSDLFNDTITEFGIKTQGFGLELTDALLPALQSILEVFGDLFDTEQDWSALFEVIKFGLRSVATVIYATIKLVDVAIKNLVAFFDAVGKALQGDFEGAYGVVQNRIGGLLEQARRDFAQIQKIWTDSPSPGTGRRTRGRNMALDTGDADRGAAAASRRAEAERKRAEAERKRAATELENTLQDLNDFYRDINDEIKSTRLGLQGIGASATDAVGNAFQADLNAIESSQAGLIEKADELSAKLGISLENVRAKLKELGEVKTQQAVAARDQSLKDLLPSLEEYDAKIAEVTRGKTELTELEKLNAEVNLLQLDILAQTNPALAEHVRLLRERAAALDAATEKQKKDSESIGAGIKDRLQDYYNSVKDLGGAIGEAVVSGLQGLEDRLTEFVTTGKANFKDLARSILTDLARIALRAAIITPIVKALGGMFPGFAFANGGIMTGDGPVPLKKYANGGIATSPQLALYGEGSKPEAYVPLPDGRRIPVAMQGGGGGNTTVNVSVDAKGSQVQGNSGQGEQLGRAISQAVQAELIKQRRPGGLLAAA